MKELTAPMQYTRGSLVGNFAQELFAFLAAPCRGTQASDLVRAIGAALEPHAQGIVNVVGDSIWQEDALPHVPDFMRRNKTAFSLAESFEFRHRDIA